MRKVGALLLASLAFLLLLPSCAQEQYFQDGDYAAEFAEYDSRGYKDYLRVTVKDNAVISVEYDAVDVSGIKKSQDADYEADMRAVQDTYPEKYSADLVNQYLEAQKISGVDALAGATYSSNAFIALFTELEKSMLNGDTEPVIVPNVSVL